MSFLSGSSRSSEIPPTSIYDNNFYKELLKEIPVKLSSKELN